MFKGLVVGVALMAMAGSAAFGQADTTKPATKVAQPEAKKLAVWDKAPALSVKNWVKGEPVTGFEKGRVYVVEFWATWCGPCIASMPHLSDVQKKYKDKGVTVIGVTSEDPNNTLDGVQTMVKDKGDGMGYTVAWDDARKTNEAYMKASGQRGIPTSFIIDGESKVAWIGHPMQMDEPLAQVVAGKWTPETAKAWKEEAEKKASEEAKAWQAVQGKVEALQTAIDDQKTEDFYKVARELVADPAASKNPMILNMIAWTIIDPDKPFPKQDLDFALSTAEKANEAAKGKDAAIMDTLALANFLKGNVDKAIEIQTKAVEMADDQMREELEGRLKEFKEKKAQKG